MNQHKQNNQKGFTLIEMAIVVTIVGMIMASIVQLYSQRVKFMQAQDTQDNIEQIDEAIGAFLRLNGRYPCPASLTISRDTFPIPAGQTNYGRETDCNDGFANTIVANGVVTTADNVRIGTVPFKELNLQENDVIDGYHNRIIYAVTESQAVQGSFSSVGGRITLLDEDGINVAQSNLHYALFSTGENGVGGYSREGGLLEACRIGAREFENCDMADSTFISAIKGENRNNLEFDDVISYNLLSDMPTWQIEEGFGDEMNTTEGKKVRVGPGTDPEEELDVIGIIRAQDNTETAIEEGKLQSSNICGDKYTDEHGNRTANCFPSDLIGKKDAPHDDMVCPSGEYMIGIAEGKAQCSTIVQVLCPPGQFMVGVNADGSAKCNVPIPKCPSESVVVCSAEPSQTLIESSHGDYITLVGGIAGNPRTKKYQCLNGSWSLKGSSGLCSCTAGVTDVNNGISCGVWSSCGSRFSGTRTRTRTTVCPSGKTETTYDNSSCSCIESVRNYYPGCASYFNKGNRKWENKHDCSTEKCTGWNEIINTCGCEPKTEERNRWCPSGFSGKYVETRATTCPNGTEGDGPKGFSPYSGNSMAGRVSIGSWVEKPGDTKLDNCTCKPSTTYRTLECPPGQHGSQREKIVKTCDPANPHADPVEQEPVLEVIIECAPIPPIQCKWKWLNASGTPPGDFPLATKANETTCDCGSETNDKTVCSKPAGDRFHFGICQCEVVSSE